MIFKGTGPVSDVFHVTGLSWSPSYLLAGARPVLFESGFSCAGLLYERDIRHALGGSAPPELLFLTHVHWDHCGGTDYLKRAFPGLRVAASPRAASIIARPNARALMARLSADAVPLVAAALGVAEQALLQEPFQGFEVDFQVDEGAVIDLGNGLTVQVLASPGHTRDLLSYYIPEKKILVATEATGILDRAGNIVTEFLVDYELYIASLKRLASLPAEILCQGHHFVFVGRDEVQGFFTRSIKTAEEFKTRVFELLQAEAGSVERVVAAIKAEQYDTNPYVKQAEAAYLLNLTARISHLAAKWRQGSGGG